MASWLKNLFNWKKEEPVVVITEGKTEDYPVTEQVLEPLKTEKYGPRFEECDYCKDVIEEWQKRSSFGGHRYHKKCFKNLRKDAQKYAFG